jgi:predicted XRE-type DNA-binding protein
MTRRPNHVTKGDVLDDLGLSRSEASALKIKADLLDSILDEVRRKGYSQARLAEVLDEYQPNISNLLQGKITKVSIEKLLRYMDRLNLAAEVSIKRRGTKHSIPA